MLTLPTYYLSEKLYKIIIIDYCKNVKVLRYTGRWRPPINEILMNLLPLFKNIKIFTLMNCYISDETLSTCLETTTRLERLKLSIETYIDGIIFKKIKNLTHLSIICFMFINPHLPFSVYLHMYVILTDFCIICIEFKFVFVY